MEQLLKTDSSPRRSQNTKYKLLSYQLGSLLTMGVSEEFLQIHSNRVADAEAVGRAAGATTACPSHGGPGAPQPRRALPGAPSAREPAGFLSDSRPDQASS